MDPSYHIFLCLGILCLEKINEVWVQTLNVALLDVLNQLQNTFIIEIAPWCCRFLRLLFDLWLLLLLGLSKNILRHFGKFLLKFLILLKLGSFLGGHLFDNTVIGWNIVIRLLLNRCLHLLFWLLTSFSRLAYLRLFTLILLLNLFGSLLFCFLSIFEFFLKFVNLRSPEFGCDNLRRLLMLWLIVLFFLEKLIEALYLFVAWGLLTIWIRGLLNDQIQLLFSLGFGSFLLYLRTWTILVLIFIFFGRSLIFNYSSLVSFKNNGFFLWLF